MADTIWYVIHGRPSAEIIQRSFHSKQEALDAACSYIGAGEFVRELGPEGDGTPSRRMEAAEILRICQQRLDGRSN